MYRLVGLTLFLVSTAHAQTYTLLDNSFTASTHFIGAKHESVLNWKARSLRDGNYETSGGDLIVFEKWYTPVAPEINITWLTQINKNVGVIWGFGSGEHADKYTIYPSAQIGFAYHKQISKNHSIGVVFNTYVGGEFKEHTCIADYGEIGGIREVNCRLAATTLTPEETLNFLEYAKPPTTVYFNYNYIF
jgi:hypothetical protein